MKRWIALFVILISGGAALVLCEKRKVEAPVGPGALLYFVADTEHEISRLPVSFARLSDQDEIKVGDELARSYARRFESPDKSAQARVIEPYVQKVGARVAGRAHRKLPYKFHYVPHLDFINAFALPGGHVYIGGGLMALMDSEDELAAVLGHEVEHIDHYHCAERVQTEMALRRIPLGGLIGIPLEVFEAGYSKDQELEADREGARLAVNAGYSPLGALRMFETFGRLYDEHVGKAANPQEELSRIAVGTLEGYFRSHPLTSERIEQIRRMIADERWGNLTAEKPLEVAYIFWTEQAARALARHQYEKAAKLASRSLQFHTDQTQALKVLAESQFSLAQFADAAAAYRKLLDMHPSDVKALILYADALAAMRRPPEALQEFKSCVNRQTPSDLTQQTAEELAGLSLMAGDPRGASALVLQIQEARNDDWAPDALGRLGWWYYRAGDYAQAAALLSRAAEQRPDQNQYQSELGWVLFEQRRLESALTRFVNAGPKSADRGMGLAVAHWQAREPDKALALFVSAVEEHPEWLNPRWVSAVYTPLVAQSVEGLKVERQKRLAARR